MARKLRQRYIKPELFSSSSIQRLSTGARWLFVGLLIYVDDEGRETYNLRRIKKVVWPKDRMPLDRLERYVEELKAADMVDTYKVGDEEYLYVKHFKEHQNVNRPISSEHPPPPGAVLLQYPEVVSDSPEDVNAVDTGVSTHTRDSFSFVEFVGDSLPDVQRNLPRANRIIFGELCKVCDYDYRELPPSSRGAINKMVKELLDTYGREEEDIQRLMAELPKRAQRYKVVFPYATLTPTALVKHWSACGKGYTAAEVATEEVPDTGLTYHDPDRQAQYIEELRRDKKAQEEAERTKQETISKLKGMVSGFIKTEEDIHDGEDE